MSSTTVQTEGAPLLPKPSVSPDRGAVVDTNVDRKRIGVPSTVFFIVTGVMLTIPLPVALKQTGLISGLMIMFVIAGTISYMSVALGRCWIILQERWPDKYGPNVLVRRPYPSIAFEATNSRFITYAVEVAIDITNFGVGVVDLLISAQSLDILIPRKAEHPCLGAHLCWDYTAYGMARCTDGVLVCWLGWRYWMCAGVFAASDSGGHGRHNARPTWIHALWSGSVC